MMWRRRGRPAEPREPVFEGIVPPAERDATDMTSQHGEATLVLNLLRDDDPGVVVDVGAHDGVSISNSFAFIVHHGWRGILIEPLPEAYAKLVGVHASRENVVCINAACGEQAGTAELYIGPDGREGQMSTLSTDPIFHGNPRTETIHVDVFTLTDLLDRYGAPADISLLSVDTEGTDYDVLCGLDFSRFRPRIVISEEHPSNPDKHRGKYELLQAEGYSLHALAGCNSIWALR